MAVSHKGAISFGLVHIPISLYTATQDNDIHFNQLCKDDLSRVRYKKTCAGCGKEVTTGDIVKGFEFDKDQYVVVTDQEFEMIKTEKDRSIQILLFTTLQDIRPIYYDKTYHATPEMGGERAFELLRVAMKELDRVAIARTVMGSKETLLVLIPTEDGMLVDTLFFFDEIKNAPKELRHPELEPEELTMAKSLIESMEKPFEPEKYEDEYQVRLKNLINDKISGKEVVSPSEEKADNIIDLMEALRASIADQKPKKPRSPRKSKGA